MANVAKVAVPPVPVEPTTEYVITLNEKEAARLHSLLQGYVWSSLPEEVVDLLRDVTRLLPAWEGSHLGDSPRVWAWVGGREEY